MTDGRGDGWNWDLTYKGQTLMTFFLKPSNEGMVLGFAAKELGDVHLTIFSNEGRTFCHITDKRLPLRPWNLNFDEKLLSRAGFEPQYQRLRASLLVQARGPPGGFEVGRL